MKKRQPILQDPFSGIHLFNGVPIDEEGACCSSEDDNDMDKAMDDGARGVPDLLWSQKEAEPDGWYAKYVDNPDDLDPLIVAQTLREIENLFGMEWDPKGVCVPPSNVKRNQISTLKAKYEENFMTKWVLSLRSSLLSYGGKCF
jgi:hypothetical protein